MQFTIAHLAVVMVFAIPICAILGSFVIEALKILTGRSAKSQGGSTREETQMIQQIYHGLSQMEKRIDALETLLLDQRREEKDG